MFLSSVQDQDPNFRSVDISATPVAGLEHRYFDYKLQQKHKGALAVKRFADEIYQGKAAYDACVALRAEGFVPDAILCHGRWGAGLFLKEVFPEAPLLLYSEYFSTAANSAICLMPGEKIAPEMQMMYRLANANNLITLEAADVIVSPTVFQKESHPEVFHDRIKVIHDGVDTALYQPAKKPLGEITLGGKVIPAGKEIITYVTREFESYRGFETFIRAIAIVLRERPEVEVVIAGGNTGGGYGGAAGAEYKERVLAAAKPDLSRVHFVGVLPGAEYRLLLQRSSVHVYLTVPFVLSWSMMEAMATGCALVASRTAPVEEVVADGKEALLAGLLAPEEVAAAISQLLDEPKERARLGAAARKKIERNYAVPVITEQYKKLIAEMMAAKKI